MEVRSLMVEEKYINYKISIMGVWEAEENNQAFIAIDDFEFYPTDHCDILPPEAGGGTTTTTHAPCTDMEFQCNDGTCIPDYKVCNFNVDCDDGSDEQECPSFYDFEECSIPADCFWEVAEGRGLEWVIGTGSEVTAANETNGPYSDRNNDTSYHFLYVRPLEGSGAGFTEIVSPLYQNSASECYFSFYVYLADWEPPNHPKLFPLMSLNDMGKLIKLDEIDLSFVENGMWTKVEIGIGRHRDQFKLLFNIENNNNDNRTMRAGVAIDDVSFFACGPPPVQEECLGTEFHCEVSKGCILKTWLCDLQDDCGDNSDEAEGCEAYHRTDFEDPLHPFGFFTQAEDGFEPGDFVWGNFNGSTGYRGTGPPFDHTRYDSDGHYLMISSELGLPGDHAWLWSPLIGPSSGSCVLRFYSHMHGHHLGNLTVYIRTKADGAMDAVHTINGIEEMDVNRWRRVEVRLEKELDFHVIIEANVGSPGDSDIAIDDVSFTPECKYVKILTYKN